MLEVLPNGIAGYNKQWKVSSGYRLKGVVKQESPTSDHCKGQAVDLALINSTYDKTYALSVAAEKVIPYNQIILEYRYPGSHWLHCSFKMTGGKKQAFTMVNDRTYQASGFALLDTIPAQSRA
jgi:hypothetical protein